MNLIETSGISVKYKIPHQKMPTLFEKGLYFLRGGKYTYEDFFALDNVTFSVKKGEFLGIIGENGSGKTTLLSVLANIIKPDSGNVKINGKVSPFLELGIGSKPDLSMRDNIYLYGSIMGLAGREIEEKFDDIVKFAGLEQFIDTKICNFSSGMLVRFGFSVAINIDANILLIDEVLAVGDESFQKKCLKIMKEFRERGKTILLVSHDLNRIAEFSDRVLLLEKGKITAIGSPYNVMEKYLGYVRKNELNTEGQGKIFDVASPYKQDGKYLEFVRQVSEPAGDNKFLIEKRYVEKVEYAWGSKEAQITGVNFLDKDGKEKNIFDSGETLVIRINYNSKRKIEEPVFGLAIYTSDGYHVNGPNTKIYGYKIDSIEGKGYIDYIISALPLFEGVYLISPSIYDITIKKPYDHQEKAYTFKVKGRIHGEEGMIFIPSSWELKK